MEIKSGQYYSLGKKVFWLFGLQKSAAAAFLLVIDIAIIIIRFAFLSNSQVFSGINLVSLFSAAIIALTTLAVAAEIIGLVIAKLEYGVSKVMMDDSSLKIVKGILSKNEVEIPYRRIQSVSIKQSLLYRLLGVGHVAISTTTDLEQPSSNINNESDEEVIPIMDYGLAQAVADTLTNKAEVERMQMQK